MKKTVYAFVAALMVIGSLAAVSTTLEGDRIAYVNSEVLLSKMAEMPSFKSEFAKLEAESKRYEKELEKMGAEYKKLVEEFQENDKLPGSSASKWAPYLKELKYNDIMNLESNIQNKTQYYQYLLQDKEQKLYVPLVKRYKDVVAEVAKENGYTIIVDYQGIIYAPEDRKLTRKVANKLGVSYTAEDEKLENFGGLPTQQGADPLQGAGQ